MPTTTSPDWKRSDLALPPRGTEVDAMRSDGEVVRLTFRDGLWFTPEMDMYVYYSPAFWKEASSTEPAAKDLSIVTNGGSTYAKAYLNGVEVDTGDYDAVSERMLERLGVSLTFDRDDMSLPGPSYDTSLDPISPDFDARTWETPAKPEVGLVVKCTHEKVRPNGQGAEWGHPGCGKPSVILIVSEEEVWHAGDVRETLIVGQGVCADHAPEAVHEAKCSMAQDEFLVVDVTRAQPTDVDDHDWAREEAAYRKGMDE